MMGLKYMYVLAVLLLSLMLISGAPQRYWRVVFRGISGRKGGTNDIYELWTGNGVRNENSKAARTIGSRFHGHYKSSRVNRWDTRLFTKIKLAAYTGTSERIAFEFNSYGSNKMNWMSRSFLTTPSIESTNYFSVEGDNRSNFKRRFFIFHGYGGCDSDNGWFVVAQGGCCSWSTTSTLPNIKFTPYYSSRILFNSAQDADEMAIFFYEECPAIDHCRDELCTNQDDTTCGRCTDIYRYKLQNRNKECADTCNHDSNHWCWPGVCADNYEQQCSCQSPEFENNKGSAVCQLVKKPSITTCLTHVTSDSGEEVQSKSSGTTACENMMDAFIKAIPVNVTYELQYMLQIDIKPVRPHYITEEKFGIVGGNVHVVLRTVAGATIPSSQADLPNDKGSKSKPLTTSDFRDTIYTPGLNPQNGDRVCVVFAAKGGGYFVPHDPINNRDVSRVDFTETEITREICYWLDNEKPKHCQELHNCSTAPIQLSTRITRKPNITIQFQGWKDPDMYNNQTVNASGIKSYEISIHNVYGGSGTADLLVNTSAIFTRVVTSPTPTTVIFPRSGLYAIYLGVVDKAGEGNVRMARRFVLYDNDSSIYLNTRYNLDVTSAVNLKDTFWQTNHKPVCFNWRKRFFNDRYQKSNMLKKIKEDSLFSGIYEQTDEPLPVAGTEHIDGIIAFNYSWDLNTYNRGLNISLKTFMSQSICISTNASDGDSVKFTATAIDIVDNTLSESVTMHVDSTPPEIRDVWLQRGEAGKLYVHNSTELSRMNLTFHAFDKHSGLEEIRWAFRSNSTELGRGSMTVNRLNVSQCGNVSHCYCPSVGNCEVRFYSIDLRKVNTTGQHNREYFFVIYAKNKAGLKNVVKLDILVDVSPPVKGIVKEGSVEGPDIDYTDTESVIVNYHGFIDHESGIRQFRIGFSRQCIQKNEMLEQNSTINDTVFIETAETVLKLKFPNTGKFFVSVIAFNNAMEPSEVSCSDGIVFDRTSVRVAGFKCGLCTVEEGIVCIDGSPWLITKELKRISLLKTMECMDICQNNTFPEYVSILDIYEPQKNDSEYSHGLCTILPPFTSHVIYIPHDTIDLHWSYHDEFSQLRDFMIGFGSDGTNDNIEGFKSTSARPFYKKFHEGLTTQSKFWILLKSINKAGIISTVPIGPVVIDETPPVLVGEVLHLVDNTDIYVGWNNNTFDDPEYENPVSDILFQVQTSNGVAITPYLQSYNSLLKCPIPNVHTCFNYPVSRLRPQETESEREYQVELRIYNKAGHYTTVTTNTFLLPSRFPPSAGQVFDLDPMLKSDVTDVDFHSSYDHTCVSWKGFSHHRNIAYEVGIGTLPNQDDVIKFKNTVNENSHCFGTHSLKPFVKYYSTVRAKCSGGTTSVSSDGFTIINITTVELHVQLYDGKGCDVPEISFSRSHFEKNINITAASPLSSGEIYTVRASGNLTSSTAIIISKTYSENFADFEFIPSETSQTISFACSNTYNLSCEIKFLKQCIKDVDVQPSLSELIFHWDIRQDIAALSPQLQLAVSNTVPTPINIIKEHQIDSDLSQHTFTGLNLNPGSQYQGSLKLCFDNVCTDPVYSNGVYTADPPLDSFIEKAQMTENATCLTVSVSFSQSFTSVQRYVIRQWSLSKDADGHHPYIPWREVRTLTNGQKLEVCVKEPLPSSIKKGYLCVRVVVHGNNFKTSCHNVKSPRSVSPGVGLYDIARHSKQLHRMQAIHHSKNLGKDIELFEEEELDYVTPDDHVAGIVTGNEAEKFEFYLMRNSRIPTNKCDTNPDCIVNIMTNNGFVSFEKVHLQATNMYYICVRTNRTIQHLEGFEHEIDELRTCSDGFYVDDTTPIPGKVTFTGGRDGYLTSNDTVRIQWETFRDDAPLISEHYISTIRTYQYALGSFPGSDDIVPFTLAKHPNSATINHLQIPSGKIMYASVRGTTYANQSSERVSFPVTVDTTPPRSGLVMVGNGINHFHYVSENSLIVHLRGFRDRESGLDGFWISVVSEKGMVVIPPVFSHSDTVQIDQSGDLHDGHSYYVQCRAVNRAGLSTMVRSALFIMDVSPPSRGVVYENHAVSGLVHDIDYQNNTDAIHVSWRNFYDSHSKMQHFEVALGSSCYEQDINPFIDVGLTTDHVWRDNIVDGQKYFTTVKACNGARLCTKACSDGIVVDSSPPIPGIVHVGGRTMHSKYVSRRSSLSARWFGFEDPQSFIDHFSWCIGTSKHNCNILGLTNCALSNAVFKPGLMLPVNTDLVVIVRATNRAGLYSSAYSDSFRVDDTYPIVNKQPFFLSSTDTDTSLKESYQFDDSVIRIGWQFTDHESHVMKTIVSLTTHTDGRSPMEELILGNENRTTVVLNATSRLMSGDRYTAVVTACNNAHLCITERSEELVIDSTPPHVGGFKLPMEWKRSSNGTNTGSTVYVSWYGFSDPETDIHEYFITMSETYSGKELSRGTLAFPGNTTSAALQVQKDITPGMNLILTISASNKAGLVSSNRKITVEPLFTNHNQSKGLLEIQRYSCRAHYCKGDCTCSVVGKRCEPQTCVNETTNGPPLTVYAGLNNTVNKFTASSSCLSAHWTIERSILSINYLRFEWSIGIKGGEVGNGIFGLHEYPWNDVGLEQSFTYCLDHGKSLKHGSSYVVYVRAWASPNKFQIFKSDSIKIDITPPYMKRKAAILESVGAPCGADVEFVNSSMTTCGCWSNAFIEPETSVVKYEVMMGTTRLGDDIVKSIAVGKTTSFCAENVLLSEGTKYFFTVRAFNDVGLHSTLSSNGFVVDDTRPYAGVVFNTGRHRNQKYQAVANTLTASWHGFEDQHSHIEKYLISVITPNGTVIKDFESVGMQTSVVLGNLHLEHGEFYQIAVKAIDAAGYESDTVLSQKLQVDTSPPSGFECPTYKEILRIENQTDGEISFNASLTKNRLYKLDLHVSNIANDNKATFNFDEKIQWLPLKLDWSGFSTGTYLFLSPDTGISPISINVENTDYESESTIYLSQCVNITQRENRNVLKVEQISAHRLSVRINAFDFESGISSIMVGAGTTDNGLQVRPLIPISESNHCVIDVPVPHGTAVYVKAVVKNRAGLNAIFKSKSITIDNTPPEINHFHTQLQIKNGQNSTFATAQGNFSVDDAESGVLLCQYSVGTSSGRDDLQPWEICTKPGSFDSKAIEVYDGMKLYVNLRCANKVDLLTTVSHEPLSVSLQAPDISFAHVHFIKDNVNSVEVSGETVQTNLSKITFHWNGITDKTKVDYFMCRLSQENKTVADWTNVELYDYATFSDLDLNNGHRYRAEVKAVNQGHHESDTVYSNVLVEARAPRITGKNIHTNVDGTTVNLDWSDVFEAPSDRKLSYRLSIGSRRGYADIVNQVVLDIPSHIVKLEKVQGSVYLVVRAILETGTFTILTTDVRIP